MKYIQFKQLNQRFAALAFALIAMTPVSGTLLHAQSAPTDAKPVQRMARSSFPVAARQINPAANERTAKILTQVSACLSNNSCQVILIDKDKTLVDLRGKAAAGDRGFAAWEQFVAAP